MSATFETFEMRETHDRAQQLVHAALALKDRKGRRINGREVVGALVLAADTVLRDSARAAGSKFEAFSEAEIDRLLRAMRRRVLHRSGR